jgi:hypothetical protein
MNIQEVYLKYQNDFFDEDRRDVAYRELIQSSKLLSLSLYHRYVSHILDLTEWESDVQFVLFKAVNSYGKGGRDSEAIFTTYFYRALSNWAKDVIRSKNRKMRNFQSVSLDMLLENHFDQRDIHVLDPGRFVQIKESINKVKPFHTKLQQDVWASIFHENGAEIKYGHRKYLNTRARLLRETAATIHSRL